MRGPPRTGLNSLASGLDDLVLETGRGACALGGDARLVLLDRHLHFARLAALVGADHALGPHEVEEAGGARVADREGALQKRRAAALLGQHDADGLVVE